MAMLRPVALAGELGLYSDNSVSLQRLTTKYGEFAVYLLGA